MKKNKQSRTYYLFALAPIALIALTWSAINHVHSDEPLINKNHSQTVLVSNWEQSKVNYQGNNKITVYRSPSCGCCGGWIKHMEQHGFEVTDIKTEEMEAIKQKYNLPPELASCHTAIIDGYVMEGHIPADDIKRFLMEQPNLAGLTVPAMPIGTPGMESGNIKQPFAVLAFDKQGKTQIFQNYEQY